MGWSKKKKKDFDLRTTYLLVLIVGPKIYVKEFNLKKKKKEGERVRTFRDIRVNLLEMI